MTNLTKLKVSLTKHGAHKIFNLLQHFDPDEVLSNTNNELEGVDIDPAQARKNLSAFTNDKLPRFWVEAKNDNEETLRPLVLLSIIFSHHKLIEVFSESASGNGTGTIIRSSIIDGKEFTNLKNIMGELSYTVRSDTDRIEYDLTSIIQNNSLGKYATQLFSLKLEKAGWQGNELEDECVKFKFHQVLSCTEDSFRSWLVGSTAKGENPSATNNKQTNPQPFKFVAGHIPRKEGKSNKGKISKELSMELVHNNMQTLLYRILVEKYGTKEVGTEIPTGSEGTSIDVVVRVNNENEFYEIKTSPSIKKCIREAIPQLLEYAFWPNENRAKKLIIVSPNSISEDAKQYLSKLRTEYSLPIYYQKLNIKKQRLHKLH